MKSRTQLNSKQTFPSNERKETQMKVKAKKKSILNKLFNERKNFNSSGENQPKIKA